VELGAPSSKGQNTLIQENIVQQSNKSKVATYATKKRKDVAMIHRICNNTKTHLKKMIPTTTHLEPATKKYIKNLLPFMLEATT
jgi:hypothetical protein